jgi:putative addiction module antidote
MSMLLTCYNERNNVNYMIELKVTAIGNSLGVILPKDALGRLKVGKGDSLFITESPDGYRLTPYNPSFEGQMAAARKVMKKRRSALRELAK